MIVAEHGSILMVVKETEIYYLFYKKNVANWNSYSRMSEYEYYLL